MKVSNGYIEFDNPTPGANDIRISVIQLLEGGEVHSANATLTSPDLSGLVRELLSLRGILDQVNQQRPPREVEKIVQTTVQVAQPIDDIVSRVVSGVQAVLPIPAEPVPVDEIVNRIVSAVTAMQVELPADPAPVQEVKP